MSIGRALIAPRTEEERGLMDLVFRAMWADIDLARELLRERLTDDMDADDYVHYFYMISKFGGAKIAQMLFAQLLDISRMDKDDMDIVVNYRALHDALISAKSGDECTVTHRTLNDRQIMNREAVLLNVCPPNWSREMIWLRKIGYYGYDYGRVHPIEFCVDSLAAKQYIVTNRRVINSRATIDDIIRYFHLNLCVITNREHFAREYERYFARNEEEISSVAQICWTHGCQLLVDDHIKDICANISLDPIWTILRLYRPKKVIERFPGHVYQFALPRDLSESARDSLIAQLNAQFEKVYGRAVSMGSMSVRLDMSYPSAGSNLARFRIHIGIITSDTDGMFGSEVGAIYDRTASERVSHCHFRAYQNVDRDISMCGNILARNLPIFRYNAASCAREIIEFRANNIEAAITSSVCDKSDDGSESDDDVIGSDAVSVCSDSLDDKPAI